MNPEDEEIIDKRRERWGKPELFIRPEVFGDFMKMCRYYRNWNRHHNEHPLDYLQWLLSRESEKEKKNKIMMKEVR